jgi:hypothetical protein
MNVPKKGGFLSWPSVPQRHHFSPADLQLYSGSSAPCRNMQAQVCLQHPRWAVGCVAILTTSYCTLCDRGSLRAVICQFSYKQGSNILCLTAFNSIW